ncbi:MAG: pilus assembly protein PilM [Firmicutes bacterium]|nr:pilus assembly protein PilM [Bacillota bacterium]
MDKELCFSLDIGTRTIVGIVGTFDDKIFKVIDFEMAEHKKRTMFDGQIHDIESVIKAVLEVKDKLEKRLHIRLEKVSIAAAGRSLKTMRLKVERELDNLVYVDKDIIKSMEIEAVQKAQKELGNNSDAAEYYCAGYAVANYFLNGAFITKLEGHRGNSIGVEIIATFLPKVVVDSLYFVINMSGLTVESMTLEPIAALNISIQDSYKLLNIALVDIGAGTSDIALTKDGTVFAFAMVPIAGDEITEIISQEYLLDFNMAEEVKRNLSNNTLIDYEDIMGNKHHIDAEEVLANTENIIKKLAKEISLEILKYNGKSPSAVFLIGGGSRIPFLSEYIAEYLEIPEERVGVRKTDIIKNVEFDNMKMNGPEYITPMGIAVSANIVKERDFLSVTVNKKVIKLLNAKRITVADALIFIAYNPKNLIGRRGSELGYTLNGKNRVLKGEPGEASIIYVNDEPGNLETFINNGDIIKIEPAKDGSDAILSVKELKSELPCISIKIDDVKEIIEPFIFANGNRVNDTYYINEGDNVEYKFPETIAQILDYLSILNRNMEIKINNRVVNMSDRIYEGDIIEIKSIFEDSEFEKKEFDSDKKRIIIWVNDIQIEMSDKKDYIFVDIFNYIDIDTKNKKGRIVLKINGLPANYADVIDDGDRIELRWE